MLGWIRVGYNHLISNKRESNNCFTKYAHKISKNPPDFILLVQTGKDKVLPLFTCHTSIKTVIARTDWMNEKSIHDYTFWIVHSRTAKNLAGDENKIILKCSRRNYCKFYTMPGLGMNFLFFFSLVRLNNVLHLL